MENILTVRKRDEFFKFLEENGLSLSHNKAILEVAPNIITSQSILLVEKYGELYNQFLVTKRNGGKIDGNRRNYSDKVVESSINSVDGLVGEVCVKDGKTYIVGYSEPFVPYSTANKYFVYKGVYVPKDYLSFAKVAFNTLLVQGQPEEAYNLCMSNLDLLFGDVCEIGNREIRRFYEDLLRTIQKYNPNGSDYDLITDRSKNRSNDAYLIKRMYK